jgi:hypothetical protein
VPHWNTDKSVSEVNEVREAASFLLGQGIANIDEWDANRIVVGTHNPFSMKAIQGHF